MPVSNFRSILFCSAATERLLVARPPPARVQVVNTVLRVQVACAGCVCRLSILCCVCRLHVQVVDTVLLVQVACAGCRYYLYGVTSN